MRWIWTLFFLSMLLSISSFALERSAPLAHIEAPGDVDEEAGESEIGDLHPLLVHFPIVLIMVAFVFDVLFYLGKIKEASIPHWILIAAAAVAIPTVITGLLTSQDRLDNPYVLTHRAWGLTTLSYTLAHAFLRLYALQRKKYIASYLFVLTSFINVILVSITAEYGATVTHGKGLFIRPVKNKVVQK